MIRHLGHSSDRLPGMGALVELAVIRVAIYVRISKDALRRGLGVKRQEKDCRALCRERPGWQVVAVYTDNDRGATRKNGKLPERPKYKELLADVAAGKIDAVVSWEMDRLTRDPLEHEEFILHCERLGMYRLATLADDVNIETGEGLMMARVKAVFAAEETRKMGKRIKAKKLELAEAGLPSGGVRPFGYCADGLHLASACPEPGEVITGCPLCGQPHTRRPECDQPVNGVCRWHGRADEPQLIRDTAKAYIAGRSINAISKQWNDVGIPTATGKTRWFASNIMAVLISPRIAGKRVHLGEVVRDARWPAIVDEPTWLAVCAIRKTKKKWKSSHDHPCTYLLTPFIYCSSPRGEDGRVCGAKLKGSSGGRRGSRRYICSPTSGGCGHVGISAARLEDLILGTLFKLAGDDEVTAARRAHREQRPETARIAELGATIAKLDVRLDELLDSWGDEDFNKVQWARAKRSIETKRKAAADELADLQRDRATALDDFLGTDASGVGLLEAAWPNLERDEQRAIIAEAIRAITIAPVGSSGGNRNFNPDRVDVDWRV